MKLPTKYFIIYSEYKIIISVMGEKYKSFFHLSVLVTVFFDNNTLDRKSSQKYIIKLLGKAIVWKANNQDTVTTLSIEAQLLAISQTAKEAIYLSCLMKALTLCLLQVLTFKCNNKQTIQLLVNKSTKMQTKLYYVNIHSYWL